MPETLSFKDICKKCKARTARFFKRFFQFLRGIWILFKQSFRVVMLFILLCSVFTIMATSVLKDLLITLMMKVTGVEYIVPANLSHVLFNPVSIVLMIIFAVIITLFSLFEIAGLLHAFSMGQAGRTTNLMSMFAAGLRACRKALHPKNWFLIFFILVLFPLTRVFPLATSTFKLILPGFVNQTIDYTKGLNIVYWVGYIALILILTVYLFSINSFVMQKDSFIKSCTRSRHLERGHFIETLLSLILLT
ncbi:MAG: glycerophosphoryl diester phosphodiesterase membrane domain-containing protein, partial [Clostridiales bacterium]|nr:glycerophosphoryl diester phosphodiesterase membrane domain-containing protein [Clostridiales bacterium]